MYDDYAEDVILPEGFNPDDPNYTLDGESNNAGTEEPTTDPQPESNATDTQPAEEGEPTSEPEPAAEEGEEEGATIPELQPQPVTVKVRYNHEDYELSQDEAALYAQKGMNYDKLQQRATELEATNAKSEALARRLGYANAAEMLEQAEKNYVSRRVNELVEEGNSPSMAKFLVDQEMAKAAASAPAVTQPPEEQPTQPQQTQSSMTPERRAELEEFIKAYPDVHKLPQEVVADVAKNHTRLLVAYERYQNKAAQSALKDTQKENAILKQNQEAASKAPVTGVSGKAGVEPKSLDDDPFMKGFDSDKY